MIACIVSSSILILILLLFRKFYMGKIDPGLQYGLWGIVALRLLLFQVVLIPEKFSPGYLATQAIQYFRGDKKVTEFVNQELVQTGFVSTPFVSLEKVASFFQSKELIAGMLAINIVGSFLLACLVVNKFWNFNKILIKNRVELKQEYVPLKVYVVQDLPSPMLFRNEIYLQGDMADNEEVKTHILYHEYCHYKHKDELWGLIRVICLICYWYHPLVWIAAKISKQDCEIACDAAAITLLGEEKRYQYGSTLLTLITDKSVFTPFIQSAATMKNSGKQMKERITMIAKKNIMKKGTLIITGISILIMIVIILVSLTQRNRNSGPVMTVFMNENITKQQRSQLESQLLEVDGVVSYDYTSAEEAWDSFKKEYLEESYQESFEENPLENSDNYTVWVESTGDLKQMVNQIMEIEGVRKVNSVID